MPDQPDLFAATAAQLADQGMNLAADHADAVEPNWTHRAFAMLEQYARAHYEFMGEDVRQWAHREGGLPLPPDGRAWGFVIVRGLKEGLYECVGYRKTRIPPAHATPRAIWRSNLCRGPRDAALAALDQYAAGSISFEAADSIVRGAGEQWPGSDDRGSVAAA